MTDVHTATSEPRSRAAGILAREISAGRALVRLLENEYEALSEQDLKRIAAAAADKTGCVAELNAIEAERQALCRQSGFGSTDWAAFLDWCDDDGTLERSWQELTAIAGRCNTLNLSNGAIIRVRKQQIDDGIALLRGIDTSTPTYSRSGDTRDGSGHRTIAEA